VARRIVERGGSPLALAWTPDGSTLTAVSDNNVLRLYRSGATYHQQGDDITIEDDPMGAVAISPDGSTIAVGTSSGTVRQFDLVSHDPSGPALRGLTFDVRGVAYSADGSLLAATTTGLSTTRLWDVATGTPLGEELVAGRVPYTVRTLPIDHPYPSRPVFAPHGHTLYTPVGDGSVVAWDLRPSSWIQAACALTGRDLTESEWRQYLGDAPYRTTCSR
jgi:WD40 repeat protein